MSSGPTGTIGGSSSPPRSPTTTPPAATSPRRCAPPCGPRSPPATSTPTARQPSLAERALELWPRVSDPHELVPLDHVELLTLAASAPLDRRRPDPRRGAATERPARAVRARRPSPPFAMLLARLSRIQWSLNRGLGRRRDRAARAGAAAPGRGEPGPGAAAGLAGSNPLSARALPRCDRGRRGGARRRRSPPGTCVPRARCSTRWGWPRSRWGASSRGRRGCGERSRSRATTTIWTASATRTRTSPTCST